MVLCPPFSIKYRHKSPEPLINVAEIFNRWLPNRNAKCFTSEMRQFCSCFAGRLGVEVRNVFGIIYVQIARAKIYSNFSVKSRNALQ